MECSPKTERRRHPRLTLVAEWYMKVGDRWKTCAVGNVSEGGALILSDAMPRLGEEVVLKVGEEEGDVIVGNVVRTTSHYFAVSIVKPTSRRRILEVVRAAAQSSAP